MGIFFNGFNLISASEIKGAWNGYVLLNVCIDAPGTSLDRDYNYTYRLDATWDIDWNNTINKEVKYTIPSGYNNTAVCHFVGKFEGSSNFSMTAGIYYNDPITNDVYIEDGVTVYFDVDGATNDISIEGPIRSFGKTDDNRFALSTSKGQTADKPTLVDVPDETHVYLHYDMIKRP